MGPNTAPDAAMATRKGTPGTTSAAPASLAVACRATRCRTEAGADEGRRRRFTPAETKGGRRDAPQPTLTAPAAAQHTAERQKRGSRGRAVQPGFQAGAGLQLMWSDGRKAMPPATPGAEEKGG
eukprot:CAMPEP_0175678758 /NCGR_PEP_ID=MMETSP0097-20121207/23933_1 /TAXON_ID=311494 /ORGANISM="Alexandrium monilatum, Strain CCMP3105" /LENGTH=123 /DNA_ID=CAMNT_0016985559 /DNA_START=569 /DNA_END=936 /DNA_ORIENTATION=-